MNETAGRGALATLSAHTLVYLAGSLAAKLAAILLLPILTPRLSPADYGVLELTDATLALLLQLAGFQLDAALTRFYFDPAGGRPDGEAARRRRVVQTVFTAVGTLALAAAAALFLAAEPLAAGLLGRPELPGAIRLVALVLLAMLVTEVPVAVLKAERRSVAVTSWLLLRLLFELCGKIALVVAFAMGVVGVLAGQAAAAALFAAGFVAWMVRRFGLGFDRELFRPVLAFAAPMVAAGLCQFVLHSADRYMLRYLAGLHELGLYGVAYRFGYAVTAVVLSAFLLVWFPYVFALKDAGERRAVLAAAAVHVPVLLLALSLPVALFAPEIVAAFTDPAFHDAWVYVPVILFGYLAWAAFQVFQTPFYVHKRTAALPLIVGAAALVNVLANLALVPARGAMGAAAATVAALFFLAAAIRVAARRIDPFPVEWRRFAIPAAVAAAAGAALVLAPPGAPGSPGWRAAALLLGWAALGGWFLRREERAGIVALLRAARARGRP